MPAAEEDRRRALAEPPERSGIIHAVPVFAPGQVEYSFRREATMLSVQYLDTSAATATPIMGKRVATLRP
jgi:hypothetical protein